MTRLTGQMQYLGPRIHAHGLGYGALFRDGLHESLYPLLEKCPALAGLFVPVKEVGSVLRELNFDYSHNMRGTSGRHVAFYREVQRWLASNRQPQQTSHAGITLKE
jgi:hypothetical protein